MNANAPSLKYINKLSNGDEIFTKKLIDVIKTELPLEKDFYFQNMRLKKFKQASEIVHKLKHKISILSFETGYVLANEHEENLKHDNTSLEGKFDEILKIITEYLNLV